MRSPLTYASLCLAAALLCSSGQAQEPQKPWQAFGRITDHNGDPLAGVEVRAYCGSGTLRQTGTALSGEDGRYKLSFGPGIVFFDNTAKLQAATISARRPGYFEQNLNRQGDCLAAHADPGEDALKNWGGGKNKLFLPDQPVELNFVMQPAARLAGKLVDEQDRPLAGYSVALNGADLPPSSSVLASTKTDDQGRFSLENTPTTYRFQLEVRKANPKPPWNDSWASAALRFDIPVSGDLRAWFGEREIRVEHFIIRVAGDGVHGDTATAMAGIAGALDLTAAEAADVVERSEKLLIARSAVLTLRNKPAGQKLSQSLIQETVPVGVARESKTRLRRTRPNAAGELTISFENPRGTELTPGKHQVIFQVFVGVSQRPIREKIFRQLDIRQQGRYEVPVKIAPEFVDDSQVSLTFVSIQADHDAWVRTFFHEGKGTSYSGHWGGDGALLPAVPVEE